MAGILVVGEVAGDRLLPASLEAAAAGAALARSLRQPLLGALIGNALDSAALSFAADFSVLYRVEHTALQNYLSHAHINAVLTVIKACNPSVVLCPHTLRAREWVPCVAAAFDSGLIMDCTAIATEGADLVVHKPVYGGGVTGEFVVRGTPRFVTLRSGAFTRAQAVSNARTENVRVDVSATSRVTLIEEIAAQAGSGPKLSDAKIVVSGGRGLGSPDNWHTIEAVAAALNAAVGCSRPVADSGWVNSSHQVGLSGSSINAELYVAVGISGAVQHLAGINSSATVVAINSDAQADIFTRANYGVVGDYKEVLPAFVERIKKLKG